MKIFKRKTRKEWPHKGWWGHPMSLDPIFDMPLIKSVFKDYQKEASDKEACLVMMTGRPITLANQIKKILNKYGLRFHEYHFHRGGSTDASKMITITELLAKYPKVDKVEMWEDRPDHVTIFETFGKELIKSGMVKAFKVNYIKSDRH
jgi:hypothetical protein